MRRPRVEIAKAVLRLSGEVLLPVGELCALAGASEQAVVRWIVSGRNGRFLDGVRNPARGWLSSREALGRFLAATVPTG